MSDDKDDFNSRVEELFKRIIDPESPARAFHTRRIVAAGLRFYDELDDRPEVKNNGAVKQFYKVPGGYIVEYDSEDSNTPFKESPFTIYYKGVGDKWVGGHHFHNSFLQAYVDIIEYKEDIHGLSDAVQLAYAGARALKG